jgi:hypothetical protein
VPRQRQVEFFPGHSGTVIPNANQLLTTRYDVNRYCPGTGIEAVFDKLLDDRRWPLDDFAGSDLVDKVAGQLANWHPIILSGNAVRVNDTDR